jgi:hypothetical protein
MTDTYNLAYTNKRMTDTYNLCSLSAAYTNSFNPTLSGVSITLPVNQRPPPTPHMYACTHTHTHTQISKPLNQDEQYKSMHNIKEIQSLLTIF